MTGITLHITPSIICMQVMSLINSLGVLTHYINTTSIAVVIETQILLADQGPSRDRSDN